MSGEPAVTARERELLAELEICKRRGEKLTVIGFCKRQGYANKSALRHFPVLRRELGLYIAGGGMSGKSQPSAVTYLKIQNERLTSKCNSQEEQLKRIPALECKLQAERVKTRNLEAVIRRLLGLLSTVIALIAGSDLAKARDISSRLEALILKEKEMAQATLENQEEEVPVSPQIEG